jgi:hypothetical protein
MESIDMSKTYSVNNSECSFFSSDTLKCYTFVVIQRNYFIDHSTHLENLFVGVGNSELSNKIASYTTDENVFVIKTVCSSDDSYVAGERKYR